jgi:polysaccharide chain length determinant protein (PEP-CTERM system associated)
MRDDLARLGEEDEAPQKGVAIARLRAAWGRWKWLAVLAFAVPFIAAASMIFALPTFYRSTAMVLVDRQQVPEAFVRPTVTSEIETRLQSISQETLSRSRLEALIAQFGLYPGLRKQASEEIVERMRKDIKLELKATTTKDGRPSTTTAFALSYQGPDPQTVAAVTNTLVSFYIEENLQARARQATGTADFLKTQLAETRKRLDNLETPVTDFRKRNLGELPQQMQANLVAMENLNTQLRLNGDSQVRAAERRESLTALLAEAATSPQAMGAVPGAPPVGESRAMRLVRLRQELAATRSRFTEQHPSVARLKGEIAATEGEPAEVADDKAGSGFTGSPYVLRLREMLHAAESEIKVLKAEEQRLRAAVAAYQVRLENTPKREQELQELSRDYESTKQLYESLSKRHEEARLAESMEQRQKGEQFRVLDPAIPSQIPAAPNRLRLVLVSLVASLGLAGAALVLAETLDTSFHSKAELRAFTGAPVIVSIPWIVTASDRTQKHERFKLAMAGAMLGLVLVAGASYFFGHGNERLVQILSSRDGG